MSAHEHLIGDEETTPSVSSCVHVAEEFQLFQSERTEVYYFADDIVQIFSEVCLATKLLEPLLLTVFAEFDATLPRLHVVTPCQPEQGYPLDQADFSVETRQAKIVTLREQLIEPVEGLALLVGYADDSPSNIFRRGQPQHIYRFLDQLHLALMFPNGSSFVSRAHYDPRSFSLMFEKFFPADTGPLPTLPLIRIERRFWRIEEGLRVLLPPDLEQLQRIKGKFVYLPE